MTTKEAKRQRRMRRQNHRRKATKVLIEKRFGPSSGMRKHAGTSLNPMTKQNNSTRRPIMIRAPKLRKLFSDAFKMHGIKSR